MGRHGSTAGGTGSIPAQETNIQQAAQQGPKEKKKKQKPIPKHLIKYVCNVLSDSHGKVY